VISDNDLGALREFRAEVPFPDDATAARVFDRVTSRPSRGNRLLRGRRRRLAVVVPMVALLLAAASLAAVREGPWWQDAAPPVDPQGVASVARDNMPATVDVARARTVARAGDGALIAVPLNETGYCLIPAIDGHARLGASCVFQVANPERGDDDLTKTATRARSHGEPARWIVYGRIVDPRASKIDLGAFTVELARGGFFMAEVPEGEWARLDGGANPGAIVDRSGSVLRRGCVNWGASPNDSRAGTAALWIDGNPSVCKPQTIPAPPTLDLDHAKKLFDVKLTQPYSIWKAGETISFEAASAGDGTTCAVAVGPGLPRAALEHGCTTRLGSQTPGASALSPGIGASLAHDGARTFYSWSIAGSTDPAKHVAKIRLGSPSGTVDVEYAGDFFFAQLPVTTPGPVVGTVPFPDGPWLLTAYDAAGREVARVDLNQLHRQASPH
jgi:hypothetical protein